MSKANSSRFRRRGFRLWATFWVAVVGPLLLPVIAVAQAAEASSSGKKLLLPAVAARVDGDPIYVAEVEKAMHGALRGQKVPVSRVNQLRAAVLSQLVDRRLGKAFLDAEGLTPTSAELDAALGQFRNQLKQNNVTMEQFLQKSGASEAAFRAELVGQIGWQKYVQANLDDQDLEAFFNENQRELDGTELRVSHILLRPVKMNRESIDKLTKQAEELRQRIVDKDLTFEDAARQHSDGPSRERGGDIGYVPRRGLMVEAFSKAVFELNDGQISQPVETPFGIHLIRVTETKPGTRQWTDLRDQLKQPVAQKLIADAVNKQRAASKVEFTRAAAHFDPETRELILPQANE